MSDNLHAAIRETVIGWEDFGGNIERMLVRRLEGYVKMPSREALRGALSNVLCNAMNYPPAVRTRVLGQDMTPLLDGTADVILALLAGETS